MGNSIRRVAITGASGYLGSALINRLQRNEAIERVLAIDTTPPRGQASANVIFQRQDVAAPMADLFSNHGVEAVVHLAFILRPGRDREAVRRVNVGGTANVLSACDKAEVRHILYLSSTTVYGAHRDNPALLTEDSPLRPVKGFHYGEDKVYVEALLGEYTEKHPTTTVTVLRACPVMGPTADNLISRALSKPFLVGVRGHDPEMQFLHEEDLVDVILVSLDSGTSGVYNIAGDGTILWSELASTLGRKLVMLPAPIVYGLTGATWLLRLQNDSPACGLDFVRYGWAVSTEKIKRELDISPRYSSRDAWEAFVQGHQEPVPS